MSGRSRISALLRHIRFDEVLVLQGTPLMGVAFSIGTITAGKLETLLLFLVGSILLVAHVFTLNDWADAAHGLKAPDPRVPSRHLFWFSLSLLIASLLVFALLGSRVVILGLIVAALGFSYSHPKLNAKGTPIASSVPHLIGGLFHFLLGYAVFMAIDERGILIALFFALTFAAGHLNHEVRDFDLDFHNNARTNAVAFGKRPAFVAGLIVFTFAYLCLFILGWFRFVPRPLAFLALVFYPLHLYWSLRALRRDLNPETLDRFQIQYRSLYAVIGISMLGSLFYR
jgi:4-hydroxybenzoate polyprenyltransferase